MTVFILNLVFWYLAAGVFFLVTVYFSPTKEEILSNLKKEVEKGKESDPNFDVEKAYKVLIVVMYILMVIGWLPALIMAANELKNQQ